MAHPDLVQADNWRKLEARLMGLEAGLARLDRRLDVLSGLMRALDMRLNTIQAYMEHQSRSVPPQPQTRVASAEVVEPAAAPEGDSQLIGFKKPRRAKKADASA